MFKKGLFLLTVFIIGCGQKGPLFLPEKGHKTKEKVIKIKTTKNKKQKLEPVVILVKPILINAKKSSVKGNSSSVWQELFKTNKVAKTDFEEIRYVLFKTDLLNLTARKTVFIGNIANKKATQKTYKVKAGNYLKFRMQGKGYDKIPNFLLRINKYIKSSKTYKRVGNSDFMIERADSISVYIQVI